MWVILYYMYMLCTYMYRCLKIYDKLIVYLSERQRQLIISKIHFLLKKKNYTEIFF